MTETMPQWPNRIVGNGTEDPEQLLANPKNWRIHPMVQEAVVETVVSEVGWVRSVLVNRLTGYVVDGHMRVALAIKRGQRAIPVEYVELTEDEEALILATLDPTGAMAGTDRAKLKDLSAELALSNESNVGSLLAELSVRPVQLQPPRSVGEQIDNARKKRETVEPVPVPARSRAKVKRDLEALFTQISAAIDGGEPFALQWNSDENDPDRSVTIMFTEGEKT